MLVKFSFKVEDNLRLADAWPINHNEQLYEWEVGEKGTVISVSVTVTDNNEMNWPQLLSNSEAHHISFGRQPALSFLT